MGFVDKHGTIFALYCQSAPLLHDVMQMIYNYNIIRYFVNMIYK